MELTCQLAASVSPQASPAFTYQKPSPPRPTHTLLLWSDLFRDTPSTSTQLVAQACTGAQAHNVVATGSPQLPPSTPRPCVVEEDFQNIFDAAMASAQAHQASPIDPTTATALSVWAPRPSFRPNQMALAQRGLLPTFAQSSNGSNTKYRGDQHSNSFLAQLPEGLLPDEENCSLFVTNIPAKVTARALFDQITVGAVYALHMVDPDATHPCQAAKLVFMNPESAQRMMKSPNIWMRGHCLGFRYNRYGYRRNTRNYSRVLIVEGPEAMMNLDLWNEYFVHYSKFVWDRVLEIECATPGNKAFEFRFSRIDGQAETCLLAIRAEPAFAGTITVKYGADPCAGGYED